MQLCNSIPKVNSILAYCTSVLTFALASTSISTISRFPLPEARANGVSWCPPVSGSGMNCRIEINTIEMPMQGLYFLCWHSLASYMKQTRVKSENDT